jgi:hypothetical protein
MSSPDGTCSLSFSAQATALLTDPYVQQDLPASELVKLEGPARISGEKLQVSVHNGSSWNVKEITVSMTIVRPPETSAAQYEREDDNSGTEHVHFLTGRARLLPASQQIRENKTPAEKQADTTVLYHLKGAAAPDHSAIFQGNLSLTPENDQEWHWAIVQAKGLPEKEPAAAKQ